MTDYHRLNATLRSNQNKYSEAFQTTEFWEHAAVELEQTLGEETIKSFRQQQSCLSYFVPTYGSPGNGLTSSQINSVTSLFSDKSTKQKNQIANLVNGYESAKADHRLILALESALAVSEFKSFTESTCGDPLEQFTFEARTVSRASQNYLLGLLFFYLNFQHFDLNSVIEIGGGFGSLGEILGKSGINIKRYVNFDIPPTCLFADYYLSKSLPSTYTKLSDAPWDNQVDVESLEGFYARPNYDVTKLFGTIDLVVNYHSFQEMEPHVVKAYIEKINEWETQYLLLRNIREGKQLKTESTAGVVTPIKTDDYLSWLQNYELVSTSSLVFGNVTSDNFHSELMLLKRI